MLRTNYSGLKHTTAQQKSIQHENVVLKHMYIFLIGLKKKKKRFSNKGGQTKAEYFIKTYVKYSYFIWLGAGGQGKDDGTGRIWSWRCERNGKFLPAFSVPAFFILWLDIALMVNGETSAKG